MSYLELQAIQNIEELAFIQDLLYHSVHSSFQPSNPLFQSKFSLPSRDSADLYTLYSMISLLSHPMKWQSVLRIQPLGKGITVKDAEQLCSTFILTKTLIGKFRYPLHLPFFPLFFCSTRVVYMVSNRADFSLFTNFAAQVQIRFDSSHDSVTYSQQQVRCLCDSCLFRH